MLLEVIQIAEFRMHRVVTAFLAADGVGATHIAGLGRERIVLALAVRNANRD